MTAKEKALELVDRFINVEYLIDFQGMTLELAKQCALISVDEILNEPDCSEVFWEEVKQEIKKI